ncbi:ABC transporter permease [Acetobacteraceae bacterium H6797]|nr:ABC transporter permease [Acetobacteraceae bacterium H6797]
MTRLIDRTIAALLYAFLLAPLVFVLIVSVNGGSVPSFPPRDLSLRWYGEALHSRAFMDGLVTSLWLALAASAIATPIGTMAAFGIARGRFAGKAFLEALFLSPLIVPGIVIGIAALVWLAALDIREAWFRLVLGHALIVLPYSVRTVLASLARFDASLEEAALVFGASRRQVLLHVTLPLLRQSIAAGAIFAFILSFDDVSVSLFLTDAHTSTLPMAIMSYMQYNFDPSIAAISAMIILATMGGALAIERLYGLKRFLGS